MNIQLSIKKHFTLDRAKKVNTTKDTVCFLQQRLGENFLVIALFSCLSIERTLAGMEYFLHFSFRHRVQFSLYGCALANCFSSFYAFFLHDSSAKRQETKCRTPFYGVRLPSVYTVCTPEKTGLFISRIFVVRRGIV